MKPSSTQIIDKNSRMGGFKFDIPHHSVQFGVEILPKLVRFIDEGV